MIKKTRQPVRSKAGRSIYTAMAAFSFASATQAVDFDVQIINLSQGLAFTPLAVAAHVGSASVFTAGEAASTELQAVAEGGDLASLETLLTSINATVEANPAGGLLLPGLSATASLNTDANPENAYLSIVAMILPSNDGFIGLRNWPIPTEPGTYSINVNAYDSGTEANDEIRGSGASGQPGFPVPPGSIVDTSSGTGGTGISGVTAEGFVHIHRGVLGDNDASGGTSDIDYSFHRWLNPVARVIVTVN